MGSCCYWRKETCQKKLITFADVKGDINQNPGCPVVHVTFPLKNRRQDYRMNYLLNQTHISYPDRKKIRSETMRLFLSLG